MGRGDCKGWVVRRRFYCEFLGRRADGHSVAARTRGVVFSLVGSVAGGLYLLCCDIFVGGLVCGCLGGSGLTFSFNYIYLDFAHIEGLTRGRGAWFF